MRSVFGAVVCLVLAALAVPSASIADAGAGYGWGTAGIIATDLGDTDRPYVATDAAGNAMAVWYQHDTARYNIWANRFVSHLGAWETARLIETDNSGHAGYPYGPPRVALDGAGNAIAVWTQYDGGMYSVWAARYVASSGLWATARTIEMETSGDAIEPHLAMNQRGEAVVVWQQSDGSRYNIFATRYLPGPDTWQPPFGIEFGAGQALHPHVALDPAGNAVAVWQQYDGSTGLYDIWANRYDLGAGIWLVAGRIEGDNTGHAGYPSGPPRVAVDGTGNAVAVWQQYDSAGRYSIWANRYVFGSTWQTAATIELNNVGDAYYPQVAMDPSGTAVAVWQHHDGARYNIWANRFVGGAWETATRIETDNMGEAIEPQVSMDPSGKAVAVWYQSDAARYNVWANRFVPGRGEWGTATLIERDDSVGHAWFPHVAMDASGHAFAVWRQQSGARYTIWANRFVQDNVPPALDVTSPTDDVTNVASTTVAGFTEPGAVLTVNGGVVQVAPSGRFSTSISLAEGPNVITVRSSDSEGNIAERLVSVASDTLDPVVSISTPPDGAVLGSHVVRIAGNASDTGSGIETLSVNGVMVVHASPWAVDLILEEGEDQTLVVTAADRAGNTATAMTTITIDTRAPSLALIAPTNSITDVGEVTIAGTTDPGTVVTIDGTRVSVDEAGAFGTTVSLADGVHTFIVVASDVAGNTATVARTVTVDTVDPVITLTRPAPGTLTTVGAVVVSGSTEPGARLSVNGFAASVGADGTFSLTLPLSAGPNAITVIATDMAGNQGVASVAVTYADPAPRIERDLREALDALAALREEQNATGSSLNDARSRLDSAGVQSFLLLALLIVLLALNAFQFLRKRPRKEAPMPAAEPAARRTDEVPEDWREDTGASGTEEAEPAEHTAAVEFSDADDAATRIARLDQMKAEGLLTEEEYEGQRKEILGQL